MNYSRDLEFCCENLMVLSVFQVEIFRQFTIITNREPQTTSLTTLIQSNNTLLFFLK